VYNIPFPIMLGAARSSVRNDVGHGELRVERRIGDAGNW
jgi:hypothetical protein